jgi:hypothetical protein
MFLLPLTSAVQVLSQATPAGVLPGAKGGCIHLVSGPVHFLVTGPTDVLPGHNGEQLPY